MLRTRCYKAGYSLRIIIPKPVISEFSPSQINFYTLESIDQYGKRVFEPYDFALLQLLDLKLSHRYEASSILLRRFGGSMGFNIAKSHLIVEKFGLNEGSKLSVDVISLNANQIREGLSSKAIVFKVDQTTA